MGSLDTKSDPEPKHETESNTSEPPLDSSTTSDKKHLLELTSASDSEDNDKKVFPVASPSSSMSISSTDSKSEKPFQDSDSKNGGKVDEGVDYTSETPPIQVMERPTTPKYRIPSSVFARKQSGSQDWAMASNESLFSIQMSFNYQDSINWKSGELERYLQEVGTIPESNKTGKTHGSETGKDHELSEDGRSPILSVEDKNQSLVDKSKNHESSIPDEPVNPISQENPGRKSAVDERTSRVSAESESAKSFTFPILTEDTDKGGSLEPIPEKEQPEQEKQPKPDKPASTWTNCFGLASPVTRGAKKEEN
ncbi:hypothetical protein L1887_20669 [Cichorium endivia]|nr:hypothetical protein L1887_20669 [Cichorium endivia]